MKPSPNHPLSSRRHFNERNQMKNSLLLIVAAKARASVTVDFAPLKNSRADELAAKFDIVMGVTPAA
jgi:hypothetical protein